MPTRTLHYFLFGFLLLLGLSGQLSLKAQPKTKKKARPNPVLILADKHFNNHEYYLAGQEYGRVLRHDSSNAYAMFQMAECYRLFFDYKNAERLYKKVAERFREQYPFARFWYATMLKDNAHFQKAIIEFNRYRNEHTDTDLETELYREKAIQEIKGCEEAIEADKQHDQDKHLYKFRVLPKPVNSQEGEYSPVIYDNDSVVIVTSSRKGSVGGGKDNSFGGALSDMYRFKKESDSLWTAVHHSHHDEFQKLNTPFNESAGSITGDKKKFYFTRCDEIVKVDNYQEYNCAIYVSINRNGKWEKGVRLNENINMPGQWNSQPSISPDGNILFFVSKRPGGLGMHDIWYSTCNGDDAWGPPINLGDRINTLFVDMTPRYYSDQKVLFFSSNGHGGRGGLDIFMAREEDGFENIINLGTPFNSNRDDFYFILGEKKGYLTSNRENGIGFDDIYTFNIKSRKILQEIIKDSTYDENVVAMDSSVVQPKEQSMAEIKASQDPNHSTIDVQGHLLDSLNGKPAANQEIVVRNSSGEVVAKTITDSDGKYNVSVPNDNYSIAVNNKDPKKTKFIASKPEQKFIEKPLESKTEIIANVKADATPERTIDFKGTIRDSITSKPLAGKKIQVLDQVGNVISETTTDANGNYAINDIPSNRPLKLAVVNDKPGTLAIRKDKPVMNYKTKPVTAPVLTTREFEIQEIPRDSLHDQIEHAVVSGIIKNEKGAPVTTGTVLLKDEFGNTVKSVPLVNGKYETVVKKEGEKGYKIVYTTKAPETASFSASNTKTTYKRKKPVAEVQDALISNISPDDAKGAKSMNVEGRIFYEDNGKPASGATILLLDDNGTTIKTSKTDANGYYKFANLPADRSYRVILQSVKKDQNRALKAGSVAVSGSDKVSTKTLFENIYFDFDSYELRPEAKKTLDNIVEYCKKNPNVQIELYSNTDSYGTPSYNKILSGKRGSAAQDYLVEHGLPQSSVVVNAVGEGKSIANNNTEIGRQLNRRVEFYILGGSGYETPFMTEIIPPKRTLYSLAKEYNMTVDELKEANGLVGDELKAFAPLRVKRTSSEHGLLTPATRALAKSYVTDESRFTKEQRKVFERNKEVNKNLGSNKEYLNVVDSIANEERNGYRNSSGIVFYITQPKNTLYNIAKLYGMRVDELKVLNNLNSDTIYINQKIKVDLSLRDPSVQGYVVKEGDTISGIAQRFGLSIDELLEINNLDGYILRKNMILRLKKE
ncbi:MAG: carboxypeptidase regulatory-like domain-containing protein [Cytophagaceae bacterium]|jgi:outer membrane protein OmpA-like peptidoglycan-associated protein/LysM repeat protein|nr:carboxypeptidase regulatory-like domain-containing protein [Cytophagaceae bacterium]